MEIFEIVTYFVLLLLITTAVRVVTTSNVIHAAISLVFTLALTSVLFLLLSTEFVALVLVLVYIGAVIVLFLFGIMITRAPLGKNAELDNDKNKKLGAAIAGSIFLLFSYILVNGFDGEVVITSGSSTELLGEILLSRFVFPFELVSFILLVTDFISIFSLFKDLKKELPFLKISSLTFVPLIPLINLTASSIFIPLVEILSIDKILSLAFLNSSSVIAPD